MSSSLPEVTDVTQLKILSNPIRIKILLTIAEGAISFSSLKEELNLTDGSLFYHLKMLKEYLRKDEQNYYRLNEKGRIIVNELKINSTEIKLEKEDISSRNILAKIGLINFHYYMLGDKIRSIIELNISLIVISWLFGVTATHFSFIESLFTGGAIVNAIVSIIHWYIYVILIFMVTKISRKDTSFVEILLVVLNGIIPYFLYLLPAAVLYYFNLLSLFSVKITLNILFVICKFWSIVIIGEGITISAKINQYLAILFAMILTLFDYAYMVVIFL